MIFTTTPKLSNEKPIEKVTGRLEKRRPVKFNRFYALLQGYPVLQPVWIRGRVPWPSVPGR